MAMEALWPAELQRWEKGRAEELGRRAISAIPADVAGVAALADLAEYGGVAQGECNEGLAQQV